MVTKRRQIHCFYNHVLWNFFHLVYSLQQKKKYLILGLFWPFLMRNLLRENQRKFQNPFFRATLKMKKSGRFSGDGFWGHPGTIFTILPALGATSWKVNHKFFLTTACLQVESFNVRDYPYYQMKLTFFNLKKALKVIQSY